jgi:S-DNA-T family DNA segregation ATPase FtsK/SpoIIIE
VCVNAIITALMCYNSPQDLRFIMVDPKRVELTGYNGIPHLISPVVVDVEKVIGVLQWVVREMDLRYRTFAKYGARNIVDFNTKASESDGKDRDLKKLPYIVVIVDELADLMMLAPDETEKTLVRLAQMARATGIHLIIATQRPSVDVVTGLIKANFPARIAFTVATSVDSRVILDSPGAEKLLGRGDMLVITPEAPIPMRAQGCWLSNPEIEKVVRHWRRQLAGGDGALDVAASHAADPITASMNAPNIPMQGTLDGELKAAPIAPQTGDPFAPANTWDEARALAKAAADGTAIRGDEDSGDKLFNDAVATVRMNGKASISLLQRRLRIGYTRSARLIEEMESKGIIGPQVPGSQFREVLNNSLTPPSGMSASLSDDDEDTMTL